MEYTPRGKSLARKSKTSTNHASLAHGNTSSSMKPAMNGHRSDQFIDQNWLLLQSNANAKRAIDDLGEMDVDSLCEDYNACSEDRFGHSKVPGLTYSKTSYEFPNHSIFNTSNNGTDINDDLDMIEEEIERASVPIQGGGKHNNLKHGGYVTSKTEDGREIFIPAVYKARSSGANSSSGYGSASDIYAPAGNTTPRSADGKQNAVFKTASAATISSFEDDILEVLPGMTEQEDKTRKGDRMLRELLKAKQDAKVEMLIESYEERVKRGELAPNLEGLPIGVVFPKKKGQGGTGAAHETAADLTGQIEEELEYYDALDSNRPHTTDGQQENHKMPSPRPKTAQSSVNHHLHRRSLRPLSATSSSFSAWNARSSFKRNKARHALKKALIVKGNQNSMQWVKTDQLRGTMGKEVEKKYAGHNRTPAQPINDGTNSTLIVNSNSPEENDKAIEYSSEMEQTSSKIVNAKLTPPPLKPKPKVPLRTAAPNKTAQVSPTLVKPTVARKPSQKRKPAPQPPLVDQETRTKDNDDIENTIGATVENQTNVGQSQTFYQQTNYGNNFQDNKDESFSVTHPNSPPIDSADVNTNNQSVMPSNQSAVAESDHVIEITTQIESDMNNIIHGTSANVINGGISLPVGIRLLDSGFDSASVSSEESCLCAAAALQAVEEGYSCPSEAFSQGTCSCACSNCLQESQTYNKGSSWTGSQDSESWSNSNSLSSYDTNMHRRKISSRRRESPNGCILAPDEQYPSPGRRNRHFAGHSNSLHPRYAYSPKRNRRSLGHMRGHSTSSASETSSAASKRYRELIKKGVPLRVSVVSGDNDAIHSPRAQSSTSNQNLPSSGSLQKDDLLFNKLDNGGFFETGKQDSQTQGQSGNIYNIIRDDDEEDRYCQLSAIPSLEEIIKEIPDETGRYPEEAKAFLNRPESDVSIKALQAVLSRSGSTTDGKQIHDAEVIIDRIFSQQPGSSSEVAPGVSLHTGLELDEAAIREIAMLSNKSSENQNLSDIEGLLAGVDGNHIRYCHAISSRIHLVNMNELLPANALMFDGLKARLQMKGSMGNIGNQVSVINSFFCDF